jgi:endonuclease/exonuclease/phosphatase family metal-dependent hydrolase
MQEAYQGRGEDYQTSHPGNRFIRNTRTRSAVRVDTIIHIDELEDFGGQGDVQVFEITDKKGVKVRIVNVYDQLLQQNNARSLTRDARRADWNSIVSTPNMVICGDFNTHSPMWDEECNRRRDSVFLENLIETHNLEVVNDGPPTHTTMRHNQAIESKIDVTLSERKRGCGHIG